MLLALGMVDTSSALLPIMLVDSMTISRSCSAERSLHSSCIAKGDLQQVHSSDQRIREGWHLHSAAAGMRAAVGLLQSFDMDNIW